MRKIFLIIFLQFSVVSFLFSQQFGGNPPSLRWKQVDTDTARIIFPEGLDSQAQRVANIVHWLAYERPFSPGVKLHKINIVLQNETTIANGYVGLGPYRSEFMLTPDPNNFDQGSLPWTDQLAVHEYRHVMQYNNFRNGANKALYYLFGEDGLAIGVNASIPDWFFEGDAVYNETFVTKQGRGRLPYFMNTYPSLWMGGKHYSFMKLRNGSLKDYIPNHYNLGFLLVNYGREMYGINFWNKVTYDASSYKGLFYPFQKAIKFYTGISYKAFYNNAFDFYKKEWNIDTIKKPASYSSKITKGYVTNYLFPYQIGNDSLLYLKSSYRQIPTFIIKDRNGEHRLRVKDISGDIQFSYRNGNIVYTAYERDPRWAWRDYSVIKLLNLKSGLQKTVTHNSKYFTPDISEDGSMIAAVQNSADGSSEIHILNATTGAVIKKIHSSRINVFTDPKFIDKNSLVTAVRLPDGKLSLAQVDLTTGRIELITPPSFKVAGYPCVAGGMIYFTASYSGNDDVFVLRLKDRKIFEVTNDRLGNYYINVLAKKGIVSHFTADGYQLKEIDLSHVSLKEIDLTEGPQPPAYGKELSSIQSSISLEQAPDRKFPEHKYDIGTKLFNFHSWRPYFEDPDFTFSLYGQNVLNTFQTEMFYHYNRDEKTNGIGFNAIYGALFPYLNFGMEYTFDRTDTVKAKTVSWGQLDTRIGLSIPLNFSKGQTYKLLTVGSNYVLRNQFARGDSVTDFDKVNFSYLHHFITWQQTIQSARQDIYPKLGYTAAINHRYAIGRHSGHQFIGTSSVYLPGIYSTHSIVLAGSLQTRDTSATLFSNAFAGARGYDAYYLSKMWRLSANYHFPVCYPDWGFGDIFYLLRLRGNVFYDFSKIYSRDKSVTTNLRSTGLEVFFDTRWWNQYPFTFGLRFSHLLDRDVVGAAQSNVLEIILPSIFPK